MYWYEEVVAIDCAGLRCHLGRWGFTLQNNALLAQNILQESKFDISIERFRLTISQTSESVTDSVALHGLVARLTILKKGRSQEHVHSWAKIRI